MSDGPTPEMHRAQEPSRSWPRRMLNRMEVDRAVFFAVAQRGWQFVAGPVTLVLIANFFSTDLQGYYYTFWSVVALQVFFELALPQTLVSTASHQWQNLVLSNSGRIEGSVDAASRLSHLTRTSLLIFTIAGVLFFSVVSLGGLWFFSIQEAGAEVNWRAPWVALMLLSALTFVSTPLLSILEGCNRVTDIYRLQFIRSVLGNLAVWVAIPLGFGLWVPAISTLIRLFCEFYVILFVYRRFFTSIYRPPSQARFDWKVEVWPFQSRVLLKSFLGYFNSDVMSPIAFHYGGAVAAGQLGMTLQVLNSLRAACASWVRVRYAQMGILVASGQYHELDRVFVRVSRIGAGILLVTGSGFLLTVLLLNYIETHYAERLLSPMTTAILFMGLQMSLLVEFLWGYIHSHRKSPHVVLSMAGSVASGLLIWWWGSMFGVFGAVAAFGFMQAVFYLPLSFWAWKHFRKHRNLAVVLQQGVIDGA